MKETILKIAELQEWINDKEAAYRKGAREAILGAIKAIRNEYAELYYFVSDTQKEAYGDNVNIKKCFKYVNKIDKDVFDLFSKCAAKTDLPSIQEQKKKLDKTEKKLYKAIQRCHKKKKFPVDRCLRKELTEIQIEIFKIKKTAETYFMLEKNEHSACVEKAFIEVDDELNDASIKFNDCVEKAMDEDS